MLSVIVPTMWAYPPFLEFLLEVLGRNSVGEVLIINNEKKSTPVSDILSHPKIRMYESPENLFVAPSWNLGAQICKYDKMAFLSDDLKCDSAVFDLVDRFLDLPNVGMVGIVMPYEGTDCYEKNFSDGSIDIINCQSKDIKGDRISSEVGIGNLFFLKKENWKDIPGVKIFHGEILQWNRMEEINKQNFVIVNCYAETPWHVSWIKMSENPETSHLLGKYQIEDQKFCEGIGFRFK